MTRNNSSAHSKSRRGKNSPPSYNSVMLKDEVEAMLKTIERDRTMGSTNGNRAILAVLSNGAAADSLTRRLRPSPWATLKVWSKPKEQDESCLVEVTTKKHLNQTIGKLDLDEDLTSVFVLIGNKVRNISFEVRGENITDLTIARCNVGQEGAVTINGASTFGGTRLDQWQVNSEHRLYIGEKGIQIRVEDPSTIPGLADADKRSAATVDSDKVSDLKAQLEKTEGVSSENWTEWWDKWKGPAAAAVAIAMATTKFAFDLKGAAGGVAIRHTAKLPLVTYTTEVLACGAKFSAVATAAGSAVLLGVATAAAVYFVPWGSIFGWLGDAIKWIFKACSGLWGWFVGWWERFKKWMDTAFNPCRLRQHTAGSQTFKHGHRRHSQRC